MKKLLISIITTILCVFMSSAFAEDINVTVNSEYVDFDTPPVIIDGRTLIPIRAVAEKIGLKVTWDQETQTASIINRDKTVNLTIGSNILTDNGAEFTIDVAPQIINDRTCLPLRAAAEAFGANVNWDGEKRLVEVNVPEINKVIKYQGTFGENELSYIYSDEIFDNTTTVNYDLAKLSAAAVMAAESTDSIKDFLEKCGFGDIKTYNYNSDSSIKENYRHKSDFTLAQKEIGGKNVVSVIIRGTAGNEWYSNFDISQNNKESNVHYGFNTAAEEIVKAVTEYAPDDSLIWICGYSRGGAVANLSAKMLTDKRKKITAYTFASPNTVKVKKADKKVNVYNFVSDNDIITKIPPSEDKWNYTRHGTTIVPDNYSDTLMNGKFLELTGRNYNAIRDEDVRSAVSYIADIADNVNDYYNLKHGDYTPYEFFTDCVVPLLTKSSFSGIKLIFDPVYGNLMRFFLLHSSGEFAQQYKDFITIEAYDDCNGIVYEHCMESYYSKICFTK